MIDRIIQESIRPVLKADGGDITLIGFSDGVRIALEKDPRPGHLQQFPGDLQSQDRLFMRQMSGTIGVYTGWCFGHNRKFQ